MTELERHLSRYPNALVLLPPREALELEIALNQTISKLLRQISNAMRILEHIPDPKARVGGLVTLTKVGVNAVNVFNLVHGRPVISDSELSDDPDY